jgi:hypothetical protein
MSGLKKTHQQFRAVLRDHVKDEDRRHWHDYRSARDAAKKARLALLAAFWYIENVGEDDPAKTDIFFELREMMRGGL